MFYKVRFLEKLSAVMGPSGAGKTSLLNVLAGYIHRGINGKVMLNDKVQAPAIELQMVYHSCQIIFWENIDKCQSSETFGKIVIRQILFLGSTVLSVKLRLHFSKESIGLNFEFLTKDLILTRAGVPWVNSLTDFADRIIAFAPARVK